VFTIPPLARAGLGEAEARERGLKFRVNAADTSSWYSSRRIGEPVSGYKVLVEEPTQRILGAHLLGAQSAEVINLFAVAIRRGITAPDLKETIFAYPTHSSDLSYML
jgi:glutathione reductase (NADPH)